MFICHYMYENCNLHKWIPWHIYSIMQWFQNHWSMLKQKLTSLTIWCTIMYLWCLIFCIKFSNWNNKVCIFCNWILKTSWYNQWKILTASCISHLNTWHWNIALSAESPWLQVKAKHFFSLLSLGPRAQNRIRWIL